jgi:hypothetical protein
MGDPSLACSGPASGGGPYSVLITWPFSDGVAETASGSYADYGSYSLAGNRRDSFYVYVGPPGIGSTETVRCAFLGITSPL